MNGIASALFYLIRFICRSILFQIVLYSIFICLSVLCSFHACCTWYLRWCVLVFFLATAVVAAGECWAEASRSMGHFLCVCASPFTYVVCWFVPTIYLCGQKGLPTTHYPPRATKMIRFYTYLQSICVLTAYRMSENCYKIPYLFFCSRFFTLPRFQLQLLIQPSYISHFDCITHIHIHIQIAVTV